MDDLILPNAEWRNPKCMACSSETVFDGDVYVCRYCAIWFTDELEGGGYIDEGAMTCGVTPFWFVYEYPEMKYAPCSLPVGHNSSHYIRVI